MKTNHELDVYPFHIKKGNRTSILLWTEGQGTAKDHFLKRGNGRLLIIDDADAKRRRLNAVNMNIHWDESAALDVDNFFEQLSRLGSASMTSASYGEILNGWNALEDLAHTLDVPKTLHFFQSDIVSSAYKKIFNGNNIPAVTPDGRHFSPTWRKIEITELTRGLSDLWARITSLAPELYKRTSQR